MKSKEMWEEFSRTQCISDKYEEWAFCGGGQEADELLDLVKEGKKRGTASSLIAYETEKEPIPLKGCYSVVTDSRGDAGLIIRNTKVSKVPFSLVHPYHAYLEGEGDRSLYFWREVHERFFSPDYRNAGLPFDKDGVCVLEEFECVWPPEYSDKGEIYLTLPEEEEWKEIEEFRDDARECGTVDGMGSLGGTEDVEKWIRDERKMCFPQFVPAQFVPDTVLMARRRRDSRIVGMVCIRHSLNEHLRIYGGNIGYSVRPDERRKGYGTEILRLALPYAQSLGLGKVLVTCSEENEASRKVILNNGGEYDGETDGTERYWIKLQAQPHI
ncbi:MAG: GNAT family N-acetyltransferase [Candidatus Ornithospirochaeta sp.]